MKMFVASIKSPGGLCLTQVKGSRQVTQFIKCFTGTEYSTEKNWLLLHSTKRTIMDIVTLDYKNQQQKEGSKIRPCW